MNVSGTCVCELAAGRTRGVCLARNVVCLGGPWHDDTIWVPCFHHAERRSCLLTRFGSLDGGAVVSRFSESEKAEGRRELSPVVSDGCPDIIRLWLRKLRFRRIGAMNTEEGSFTVD